MQLATIADLATKQLIVLRPDQKTAQVVTPPAPPAGAAAAPVAGPKTDSSFAPTGKSQVIDGITCNEYAFTTSMDMSEMNGQKQMPPEAAEMMKGMKMNMKGSLWIAKDVPGAAEYIAFQKAAGNSDFGSMEKAAIDNGSGGSALLQRLAAASTVPK